MFYSDNETYRMGGVGFIITKSIADTVLGYNPVSDRIITMQLQAQPMNVTIVKIFRPTSSAEKEDKDSFDQELQQILDKIPKRDMTYITGDWNPKVRKIRGGNVVDRFRLGDRNEEGE